MSKFLNKFKKPCFWPIVGPFSQLRGQKKNPRKSISVINFIQISSTMPKLKMLLMQLQENAGPDRGTDRRMEGWTNPIYRTLATTAVGLLIVASKITYPYQFLIIFFLLIKSLNIPHCSIFDSFIFFFQFKKISYIFNYFVFRLSEM